MLRGAVQALPHIGRKSHAFGQRSLIVYTITHSHGHVVTSLAMLGHQSRGRFAQRSDGRAPAGATCEETMSLGFCSRFGLDRLGKIVRLFVQVDLSNGAHSRLNCGIQ